MKKRIDELLERYWEANSTLEEEKELKILLHNHPGYELEKQLFGILDEYKGEMPQKIQMPSIQKGRSTVIYWIGWAASIALVVGFIWLWNDYDKKRQEELAYQEVMQALSLIQANLQKGQKQLQPLNDFKYLNVTDQLFQTTPKK
jgi:hypothetical protein